MIQIIFTFLAAERLSLGRPPSFDEIMARLNYGGAASVPFARAWGEIGFVQAATHQSACVYHSAAVEKLTLQQQQR